MLTMVESVAALATDTMSVPASASITCSTIEKVERPSRVMLPTSTARTALLYASSRASSGVTCVVSGLPAERRMLLSCWRGSVLR